MVGKSLRGKQQQKADDKDRFAAQRSEVSYTFEK